MAINYEYKYDDGRSNSLLHNASYFGKFEVAKLLIKHGAQIDSRDFEGKTPLAVAASQAHLEVVKLLLENGADVNSKDNYGRIPLLFALHKGKENLEVIKLLIEKGSDVESMNNVGENLLHRAVYNGHLDILDFFLKNKYVDVNSKDDDDWTPEAFFRPLLLL